MKSKSLIFLFAILTCSIYIVQAQPANDDCFNSENLTITSTSQLITFDLTQASINYEEGCDGLSQETDYADVWYQFTLAQDGGIAISSSAENRFAIYDSCNGSQLECFSGSDNIEGLTGGETYLIRVYRRDVYVSNSNQEFTIQTIAVSVPDCSSTQPLTITTNALQVNFDLTSEPLNYEYGCDETDANSYKDLWYEFSMPVNGSLEIISESVNLFALYDSCNGNQLACFTGSLLPMYIDNLTQNATYLLRVYRSALGNSNFQNFTITAIEPTLPTCSNPETLSIDTTETTINLDLDNATYTYELGCDITPNTYTDFWYEFTMPINGNLYINPTIYNYASIYDSCGGNMLHCFSGIKLIDDLIQGQTYTLRIFRLQSAPFNFGEQVKLKAYERLANDNCNNAEILPTLTSDNTQVDFYLAGATVNTETTCIGSSDYIADAWWQVTMPVTGNLFIDTPGGNGIAVYDACNGTELYCNASEASPDSFKLIDNLIEGNTYLIRFFNTETTLFGSEFQTMNLRVYERAVNDECTNAETIPTITNSPQQVNFYTFGSLINEEYGCGENNLENYVDVWLEFTMPNLPGNLTITSYIYNYFSVFDACSGNEIHCFQGSDQVEGLVPGQTYILRAFQRQPEMFHPNAFFDIWVDDTLSTSTAESSEITIHAINATTLRIRNVTQSANIDIYNLIGQRIVSYQLSSAIQQDLSMSQFSNGVYIVKLTMGSKRMTKKIVVKH